MRVLQWIVIVAAIASVCLLMYGKGYTKGYKDGREAGSRKSAQRAAILLAATTMSAGNSMSSPADVIEQLEEHVRNCKEEDCGVASLLASFPSNPL